MLERSLPPAQWLAVALTAAGVLLGACNAAATSPADAPTTTFVPTESPSPQPSPTPTAPPGRVLLVLTQDGSDPIAQRLENEIERLAAASDLVFSVRPPTEIDDLPSNLTAVVVYRGSGELFERLSTAGVDPARIMAIAPEAPIGAEGITVIGPEGLRADRAAFLAGYAAALLTDNYRVAVLSAEDVSPPGSATAFVNGARYYCGLCRAAHPPFADYPASVRLPGPPDETDVASARDQLGELGVDTVYLAPGLETGPLPAGLTAAGIQLLASTRPVDIPDEAWIAAIRPAPELALESLWGNLSQGISSGTVPMPLAVAERNAARLSDARYRLIEEVLGDLVAGYISTGVAAP